MKKLLDRLLNPASWQNTFLRGARFFPAFGGLYVESARLTETMGTRIGEKWPFATEGRAYLRVTATSQLSPRDVPTAVLISSLGRFGNSVIQLANAGLLAKQIGASQVFFFRFDRLKNSSIDATDALTFRRLRAASLEKNVPRVIWRTDALYRGGLLFDSCNPRARSIGNAIGKGLGLEWPTRDLRNTLTIHLRGGDIFGSNPHPNYGQPPLSFFLRVLESQPWEAVRLVSEDKENPCVEGIVNWCNKHDIPLVRVGHNRIEEAIVELGSATNVALSIGTFAPASLFIRPGPRRVYFFGETCPQLLCNHPSETYRVRDLDGTYLKDMMNGNWSNSPLQRKLMIDYPLQKLGRAERLDVSG